MGDLKKWKDPAHTPELRVMMVDQHKLMSETGQLEGVTKCSITTGYYSNNRISASLETVDDNYAAHRWIRVYVDDEAVGTFGVESVQISQAPEGSIKRTYSLQSVLWMLDGDVSFGGWTLAKGVRYSDAIRKLCGQRGKDVIFMPGAMDGQTGGSVYYERTETYRSILSDLCHSGGNRLDVDGMGRIVVALYATPSERHSDWYLDPEENRSIVLDPGWSETDSSGQAYNRSVMIAQQSDKDGNQHTIIADHKAPASLDISYEKTGWYRTAVHQESSLSPFSQKAAEAKVKSYLTEDWSIGRTRNCTCMYFPCRAGDIIHWQEGDSYKMYLVQTADFDLSAWTVRLTLKLAKEAVETDGSD